MGKAGSIDWSGGFDWVGHELPVMLGADPDGFIVLHRDRAQAAPAFHGIETLEQRFQRPQVRALDTAPQAGVKARAGGGLEVAG